MRLSNASLDRLPDNIRRPAYDRSRVAPGIVHLGIGAFHRAHQASFVDDLLAKGALDWGIIGASLRSPDTYRTPSTGSLAPSSTPRSPATIPRA